MVFEERLSSMRKYAIPVLRYGLAAVFLWFGINQVINPDNFIGYLPQFLFDSGYAKMFVMANGIFEIIASGLLIAGYFTRWIALILALHLFAITFEVGYGETGARDFGLALSTLVIFLHGPDELCLDTKLKNKNR
jgi:uncharacterized membrane protein YphA (DoxX/SURF4 family)